MKIYATIVNCFRNEKKINLHADFAIFRDVLLKSLALATLRLRFSPRLSKNCLILIGKFIFSSFLILAINSNAQNCDTEKLKTLVSLHKNKKDSLVLYYPKLINCYQQSDSLTLWINYTRKLELMESSEIAKVALLDSVFSSSYYRAPKTKREAIVIISAYAAKAYYLVKLSNYEAARIDFEEAYRIFTDYKIEPEDFDIARFALKSLGNIYTRFGDNEKARNTFTRAIEITKQINHKPQNLAGYYLNIGIACWNESNNPKAIKYFNEGLSLADISSYTKARLLLAKAQSQFELYQAGKSNQTDNEIILVQDDDQFLDKAIQNLQNASKLSDNTLLLSDINDCFAHINLEQGYFKQANKFALMALDQTKQLYSKTAREIGKAYNTVANVKRQTNEYTTAIQYYDSALTAVLPNFKPNNIFALPADSLFYKENTIFEALAGKAAALKGQYYLNKDQQLLETALACHELALTAEFNLRSVYEYESSKLNMQKNTKERTGKAIEIAYQLYSLTKSEQYINRAFKLAESSRATILLEGIVQHFVAKQLLDEDSLFYKQRTLEIKKQNFATELTTQNDSTSIQNLHQQFDVVESTLKQIKLSIERQYPTYKNTVNQTKITIDQNDLQAILDDDMSWVQYFETDSQLYVFNIAKNETPGFYKMTFNETDKNLLQNFVTIFANHNQTIAATTYAKSANALYNKILKPLNIPKNKRIVIVPDGLLNALPFEALVIQPALSNYSELPYLLFHNPVSYQHAASVYKQQIQKKRTIVNSEILAFAPIFEHTDQQLLNSEREVEALSQISKITTFFSNDASVNNFKTHAHNYNIIHLATHANSNVAINSNKAAIQFADGALSLSEIYSLKLNADLTVLSACETGIGIFETGEGIMSLSRAFAYAGCPALISSLWKINDAYTSDIVTVFYKNLKHGKTKDLALNTAKQNFLNENMEGSNPIYWAGFTCTGNLNPVYFKKNANWFWFGLLPVFVLLVAIVSFYKYQIKTE